MSDGLKVKYHLTKADGRPVDESGIYFVLKLNSDDGAHRDACIAGAMAYAKVIRDYLPKLADDLERQCREIKAGVALNNYHHRRDSR